MFTPNNGKNQPHIESETTPQPLLSSGPQKAFTPLRASKAKINHAVIKKQLINCFHKGYYTRLKSDIASYNLTQKDIEIFFEKEGPAVLSWAIVSDPKAASLDFLCEQFSPALIKKVIFSARGTNLVKTFLSSQCGFEEIGFDTPDERASRICKFISLLNLAPTDVQEFITRADKDLVTDKIRGDFEIALKLYREALAPIASSQKRKGSDLEASQQATKQHKP